MSIAFVEKGRVDVVDGAFVVIDKHGIRTQIPIGRVACVMLEPGTRISHDAVAQAAQTGTLLVWIGEGGIRLYASGQPGGARSDHLLYQAKLALDPSLRLRVVRKMFEKRFGERPPLKRSVEQLRGVEGARVRSLYQLLAKKYGIKWQQRKYDRKNWDKGDRVNRCLSTATHCLYGVTEAAVLAAGYAPAIGFVHSGKPLSFVYDIADLFKFETVVPAAFKVAASHKPAMEREVRMACRDLFRQARLLKRMIPTIEEVLAAGQIERPKPYSDAQPIAFSDRASIGDQGHRVQGTE